MTPELVITLGPGGIFLASIIIIAIVIILVNDRI